jgi:hypothetical protein
VFEYIEQPHDARMAERLRLSVLAMRLRVLVTRLRVRIMRLRVLVMPLVVQLHDQPAAAAATRRRRGGGECGRMDGRARASDEQANPSA